MNCLEYRREKLAEPRRSSDAAQAHAASCAGCAAFARSVDEGERQLERTLAVPVPDGLADRMLLRAQGGRPAWRARALAAGVVLVVALGFAAFTLHSPAGERYARVAIEHVADEPESLAKVQANAAEALREAMASAGGRLKGPLGTIRYVKLCPVESGIGWHIVFDTPEGLATVLIVPGQVPGGLQRASSGDWNALARPTPRGYYAVVTPSAQKTALVDRLIRERIDWGA